MRVFVTGASGFIGSAIVLELLNAGHSVLALVRSPQGAASLASTAAEVLPGDVNDVNILQRGAKACDAVIHTAFNHDFSKYKESCEADRIVIQALGEALRGSGKPLVITSGIGLLSSAHLITEDDILPAGADKIPRAASEEAAAYVTANGVDVYTVRLPPSVHGKGDHGFVPMLIDIARNKSKSAYVSTGNNRWPAVHRADAASLYRLIIERRPSLKTLNAVGEEGVRFSEIAKAISTGLNIPLVSISKDAAADHFGWIAHFASVDCAANTAEMFL